jgi:Xaa-Pro dipeptidase
MTPNPTENTTASLFPGRQSKLATALYNAKLDALALNPSPSLKYLTGLEFHLMERPVVALFKPHSPPVIVLPELEGGKTRQLDYPVQIFPYGEDPHTWQAAFRQAAHASGLESGRIGLEPGRMRVLELRFLEEAAPDAQFVSAEQSIAELRMSKDPTELEAMRKAAQIAQRALQATLPKIEAGMTERQVAAELTQQLLRAGSEPELPFFPIVSGGPNSANPHATPSNRKLQSGDLLVIDYGASYQGYISDITRTFAVGQVQDELAHIHKIVQQANQAGRKAVQPGITAEQVDAAARTVIEQAGYGEYFIHRTGHGLGMEGHEPPYIRAGNTLKLAAGMTFTIEPGIYLPGKGGVRIEDDVVVSEDGLESLTDLPRELIRVGA